MTRRRPLLAIAALWVLGTGAAWVELNETGKAAYARGDVAAAERLFREAAAAAPDEALPHYHHGVALARLRRFDEATAAYERALRLNPSASVAAAARAGLRSLASMTRSQPREDGLAPPARSRVRPPEPEAASDTVRLRRWWGNWFVDVVLNDMQQATFLVDTGATACAITPALADALGIQRDPDRAPIIVRGVAGTTYGHAVTIPVIRVGDVEAHDVRALIMPLDGMQGILGNTFLRHFTTTIDPVKGVLTLKPR